MGGHDEANRRFLLFMQKHLKIPGRKWRSCLRHWAISRKVAGSISDGATGIFNWHIPFDCTLSLGSTHPLSEMSTRIISWGVKAAGAYGWQPYHLHVPIVSQSGSLNLLEPYGPVISLYRDCFIFTFYLENYATRLTLQLAQSPVKNLGACWNLMVKTH